MKNIPELTLTDICKKIDEATSVDITAYTGLLKAIKKTNELLAEGNKKAEEIKSSSLVTNRLLKQIRDALQADEKSEPK